MTATVTPTTPCRRTAESLPAVQPSRDDVPSRAVMEPLDLSKAHPRATRAELAGVTFLPRSIDKFRAALPGGNLNGYSLEGFTGYMLKNLGISPNDFQAVVRDAQSDDDVAAYVRDHAVAGGADAWNKFILNREVYGGDRAEAIEENPWLADHPELTLAIDFLQYKEDNGLDED
jgi:Domain of unknown function (DUF5069)